MVVSKARMEKVDRPVCEVCFQATKDGNNNLNPCAINLEKLLDLVWNTHNHIHKETMVHKSASIAH